MDYLQRFHRVYDSWGDLRILGDDLGSIDDLDIHDDSLEPVLQYPVRMFRCLALP